MNKEIKQAIEVIKKWRSGTGVDIGEPEKALTTLLKIIENLPSEEDIYAYLLQVYGYVFTKADFAGAEMDCNEKDVKVLNDIAHAIHQRLLGGKNETD